VNYYLMFKRETTLNLSPCIFFVGLVPVQGIAAITAVAVTYDVIATVFLLIQVDNEVMELCLNRRRRVLVESAFVVIQSTAHYFMD
jgi:hypothetical protein